MICLERKVVLHAFARPSVLTDVFLTGEELEALRTGCFKYFELGGECINGPISLLSGCVFLLSLILSIRLIIWRL
jgi:hypothetical protein